MNPVGATTRKRHPLRGCRFSLPPPRRGGCMPAGQGAVRLSSSLRMAGQDLREFAGAGDDSRCVQPARLAGEPLNGPEIETAAMTRGQGDRTGAETGRRLARARRPTGPSRGGAHRRARGGERAAPWSPRWSRSVPPTRGAPERPNRRASTERHRSGWSRAGRPGRSAAGHTDAMVALASEELGGLIGDDRAVRPAPGRRPRAGGPAGGGGQLAERAPSTKRPCRSRATSRWCSRATASRWPWAGPGPWRSPTGPVEGPASRAPARWRPCRGPRPARQIVVHVLILPSRLWRRKVHGSGQGAKVAVVKGVRKRGLSVRPVERGTASKMAKTLAEKVWEAHVVRQGEGEPDLLYIDLHLLHEVTSPAGLDGLRLTGRPCDARTHDRHRGPQRPDDRGQADHRPGQSRTQVDTLRAT